jgi:hypothetical protein
MDKHLVLSTGPYLYLTLSSDTLPGLADSLRVAKQPTLCQQAKPKPTIHKI